MKLCPQPNKWNDIYTEQLKIWEKSEKVSNKPPTPLILSGWHASDDFQKKQRWEDTIKWCEENDCMYLLEDLKDEDFYTVKEMS